jgi:hypothetical protein
MRAQGGGLGMGGRRGCIAGAVGIIALAVVSPFVVLIRSIRAWRRGREIRMTRSSTACRVSPDGDLARIDVGFDLPLSRRAEFSRQLTDTVVRIAEQLRRPDDVYHLIYREPAADETVVLPVGPLLQELGERFFLVLGQYSLVGRTAVWIVLPRSTRLTEFVDPFGYDPELPGEPDALLSRIGLRWAMATSYLPSGASLIHRMVLYLPRENSSRVNALLDRMVAD